MCLACSPHPQAATVPHADDALQPNRSPDAFSGAVPDEPAATTSRTAEAEPAPRPLVREFELGDVPPPLFVLPTESQRVPLVIGAHGAGGSPEWQCDWLASLTASPTALLCLRGLPLSRGELAFYYPEHHSLGRWLEAALEYASTEYGQHLDSSFIYVGYSQGATMGALAIQTRSQAIPNLLLVEGGLEGWSLQRSRHFARSGGRKVYFACGTKSCDTRARKLVSTLDSAGVDVRVGYAEGAGHTPVGAVEAYVREGLTWMLQPSN